MSRKPNKQNAALDEDYAFGKKVIEVIGLHPVENNAEYAPPLILAMQVLGLISEAKQIARYADDPTKGDVLEAARNAATALKKAIWQVQSFNALWPDHSTEADKNRTPWGDCGLADLQSIADLFNDQIPSHSGDYLPRSWDNPPNFAVSTWERFIGQRLKQEFEWTFGLEVASTSGKERKDQFVRFAQLILKAAGIEKDDVTIIRYLSPRSKSLKNKKGKAGSK